MRNDTSLRPELASVCGFVPVRRGGRSVRPSLAPASAGLPARGILAELAALKGWA
jgi:hypothetical protein